MAESMGIKNLKLAAVLGDDISEHLGKYLDREILELGVPLKNIEDKLISANVYLGADGIVEAFQMKSHKFLYGIQWHPEMMTVEEIQR